MKKINKKNKNKSLNNICNKNNKIKFKILKKLKS